MTPFLTLYTPTYRRPQGLARCLASVQSQTLVNEIEQIVIPDHVGVGVDGMFARVRNYVGAVHGEYVCFLCDDDVLAAPDVVERVKRFAESEGKPELILVDTNKGGMVWPAGQAWPPMLGSIDLNCGIVRSDVWKANVNGYMPVYEGDYTFFRELHLAGIDGEKVQYLPMLFSIGGVSRGAAEAA